MSSHGGHATNRGAGSHDPERAYADALEVLARDIRNARISQGLSQEQAAHRAGVSVYTYVSIERGYAANRVPNPTLYTILRIVWSLGLHDPPG